MNDDDPPTIVAIHSGCCSIADLKLHAPRRDFKIDEDDISDNNENSEYVFEFNAGTFITKHMYKNFIKPYIDNEGEDPPSDESQSGKS